MNSSNGEKLPPDTATDDVLMKTKEELSETTIAKEEDDDQTSSGSDSDSSELDYVCSVCNKKFSGFVPYEQHVKGSKHAKAVLKKKKEKELLKRISLGETSAEDDCEYFFFVKKPYAVCKTCNKQFGGPESYQMHLVSKAHKQNILQASVLDQVRENGEINVDKLKELYKGKQQRGSGAAEDTVEDTKDKIDSELKDDEDSSGPDALECRDCQKCFSGFIPYTQHILSKVHTKTVKKHKLLGKISHKDAQFSAGSEDRDVSFLAIEDGILVCKLCTMTFSGPENAMMHLKSRGHLKNLEKFARWQQRKQKARAYRQPKTASLSDDSYSEDLSNKNMEIDGKRKPAQESPPVANEKRDSSSNIDSTHSQKDSRRTQVYLSSDNSHSENPNEGVKESQKKQDETRMKSASINKDWDDSSSGKVIDNPSNDSSHAFQRSSSSDNPESVNPSNSQPSVERTETRKSEENLETNEVEPEKVSAKPEPENSDLKQKGEETALKKMVKFRASDIAQRKKMLKPHLAAKNTEST